MSKIEEDYAPARKNWRSKTGKRIVFEAGYGCQVLACVFLFVAFVTPYWIQSWPRVHSGFKRIGMWQVCLSGLVLEADKTQTSYHGCWWILSTEFSAIRGWLTPSWFVFTQVMTTLVMVAELVNLLLMGLLLVTSGRPKGGYRYKKNPLLPVQIGMAITVITAIVMGITMVTFGLAYYLDRYWLPNSYLNYPSWSYGLAVVSTFFSTFAAFMQIAYVKIIRQEEMEPPSSVPTSAETSFMKIASK